MRDERYNPFKDDSAPISSNHDNTNVFEESVDETNPFTASGSSEQPEETNSHNVKPWLERLKGVGIIAAFFLVQTIASVIMMFLIAFDGSLNLMQNASDYAPILKDMFIGMAAAESMMVIVLLVIYNRVAVRKFKQAFVPFGHFIFKIVGYYALLWTATITFSIVDSLLFPNYLEEVGNNQDIIEQALAHPALAMIISICITAPIIEEYVFRYGIINKLLYGVNKYAAAVIAAFIFAFAHIGFSQMSDPYLFIHLMLGYIGQALVFGFIYVREDNIFYPIMIHIINNVQAVILIIALANLS